MVELENDELLSLSDACRALPKIDGKKPHASTLWRWCRKGIRARNGERVRLQHVRLGKRICTTLKALGEFSRRLAEADAEFFDGEGAGPPTQSTRSDSEREKAIRRAENELAEAGL